MLNEPRLSILCYNAPWHESVIHSLAQNTMQSHDMIWSIGAEQQKDCSAMYIGKSDFLTALVAHSPREDGVLVVRTTGFLENSDLLMFLRVYCHTGITVLQENEVFSELYEKSKICRYYNLHAAQDTVDQALCTKMDCTGCLRILQDTCDTGLEDSLVMGYAVGYFKRHPEDCIRKLTSNAIVKLTDACFETLVHALQAPDCNADEYDIFVELYNLCLKRCRNDVDATRSLFCHYQTIDKCSGMNYEELMKFRMEHEHAFESDFYVSIFSAIYGTKSVRHTRSYNAVSHYPRHLEFPKELTSTHAAVSCTLIAHNYSIAHAAVPILRTGSIDVPAFTIAGNRVLSLQVLYSGQHVSLNGGLNIGVCQTSDGGGPSSVELRIVNFARDRKRTETAVLVKPRSTFSVAKIILINTLTNDYSFNPGKYPIIEAGTHMLFKITCKIVAPSLAATSDEQRE